MNITHILVINIHNSVGLNICLYFRSYSPSLNNIGNKTKKNLSVLISFGLKKSVSLNILVESVLIFSVLVTGVFNLNLLNLIFLILEKCRREGFWNEMQHKCGYTNMGNPINVAMPKQE
jgi:hypothetical protein